MSEEKTTGALETTGLPDNGTTEAKPVVAPDLGAIMAKYDGSGENSGENKEGDAQKVGKREEKEEEAKPVEGATEEDQKDLPDFKGNEEIKAAFIRERVNARKRVEEARGEAQRSLHPKETKGAGERKAQGEGGMGREGTPRGEPTVEDDVKVFELRATAQRVMDGVTVDGWSEEKAQKVLKLSEDVIGEMNSEGRLLEVLERAKAGKFGELSAAMKQEAERVLPQVTARGRVTERAAAEETARVDAVKASVNAEFAKVQEKYPALKELTPGKESEEVRFIQGWMRDNVGTPEKPGRRFQEMLEPRNIGLMMEDAMMAFRSSKFEATKAERDRLQKEREGFEKPLSGGGPGAGGGGEAKPGSSEALQGIFAKYGK